jgi:hypothetical protein
MPLVLDPAHYTLEQLRKLLADQREGLTEYVELLHDPPAKVRDPASLRTAIDLLNDTIQAIDRLDPATAERSALAAGANLGYSSMLAAIDIWKSHSDVSWVPRRTPPPPS